MGLRLACPLRSECRHRSIARSPCRSRWCAWHGAAAVLLRCAGSVGYADTECSDDWCGHTDRRRLQLRAIEPVDRSIDCVIDVCRSCVALFDEIPLCSIRRHWSLTQTYCRRRHSGGHCSGTLQLRRASAVVGRCGPTECASDVVREHHTHRCWLRPRGCYTYSGAALATVRDDIVVYNAI